MKRLILILTIICLLIPASAFAQAGPGAFMQGFANGFAATRGYCPPPQVYQPPPQPQTESGAIYGPGNQMGTYTINRTPGSNSYFGTIYGPNGMTTFSGSRY